MDPNDSYSVTLTALQWNTVMRVLAAGKYNRVAPLIASIQQQVMREDAERNAQTMPDAPP